MHRGRGAEKGKGKQTAHSCRRIFWGVPMLHWVLSAAVLLAAAMPVLAGPLKDSMLYSTLCGAVHRRTAGVWSWVVAFKAEHDSLLQQGKALDGETAGVTTDAAGESSSAAAKEGPAHPQPTLASRMLSRLLRPDTARKLWLEFTSQTAFKYIIPATIISVGALRGTFRPPHGVPTTPSCLCLSPSCSCCKRVASSPTL